MKARARAIAITALNNTDSVLDSLLLTAELVLAVLVAAALPLLLESPCSVLDDTVSGVGVVLDESSAGDVDVMLIVSATPAEFVAIISAASPLVVEPRCFVLGDAAAAADMMPVLSASLAEPEGLPTAYNIDGSMLEVLTSKAIATGTTEVDGVASMADDMASVPAKRTGAPVCGATPVVDDAGFAESVGISNDTAGVKIRGGSYAPLYCQRTAWGLLLIALTTDARRHVAFRRRPGWLRREYSIRHLNHWMTRIVYPVCICCVLLDG